MSLGLEPLPPLALEVERTIRVGRRCRGREGLMALVERALRDMRAAGLEAEIYLRGTWRRGGKHGNRNRPAPIDMRIDGWQLTEGGLYWDPPLGIEWVPKPACEPRPVVVVRGVSGH